MDSPIRIGIVGARFAARFHWKGYQRVYGAPVEVVGVTSASPESRTEFGREHGVKAFDSFEALCDASDVIDICAPGSVHEELAVRALGRGKHVIIEKPFTGYYGTGEDGFRGNDFSKEIMLREAMASCDRILEAARKADKLIGYAEDWVYAPSIQKEREILVKSGGQILWMLGDESHSGSHSMYYGIWKFSGGGSLVGKGCHAISAALSLKRSEGEARDGKPIRPATVSARTHEITRLRSFRDAGFLRTSYDDIEDYSQAHITFDDGTVADIFASELVLGGCYNWLEVFANNHRTRCNLNPVDALTTYNPREDILKDVYLTEKLGTKQGWSHPAPDEDWQNGFPQEFQDFIESIRGGREPLANAALARDTIALLYSAYLSAERRGAEVEIPLGARRSAIMISPQDGAERRDPGMTNQRRFRVGITADFETESKGLLDGALEQVLRPVSGIECEVMPEAPRAFTREVLDRYDAVLALDANFTAGSFQGVRRLAVIARWGVGYDRIDVPACTNANVILAITPNSVRRAVAEGILALIFATAKQLRTLDRSCRAGLWRNQVPKGINLEGRILGSVGLGNIGGELFRLARGLGFGRLLAYSPRRQRREEEWADVEFTDLDALMRTSDFVTINCPLNEETRGMIGARQLSLMKPTAILINTARGAIVNEAALVAALRERRIAGAGLDVFENEPFQAGHPLAQLDNVILTPHSVSRTEECARETSLTACQNVLAVFRGSAPPYVVNRAVLERPEMQEKLARFRAQASGA